MKETKMATSPQTFANHTRWQAPFHFFVIPVMLINIIWSIVIFVKGPGWNSGWWIIVSLALVVMATLVRSNSLKVQDRLIQLEERLRYQQLLSAALLPQTSALRTNQIIALHLPGDHELEELVTALLEATFSKTSETEQPIYSSPAATFRR